MAILLREGDHSPSVPTSPRPKKEISHIAATAESLQPKGYTLATTNVRDCVMLPMSGHLGIVLDVLLIIYMRLNSVGYV